MAQQIIDKLALIHTQLGELTKAVGTLAKRD